jgi:hypothetical protein
MPVFRLFIVWLSWDCRVFFFFFFFFFFFDLGVSFFIMSSLPLFSGHFMPVFMVFSCIARCKIGFYTYNRYIHSVFKPLDP